MKVTLLGHASLVVESAQATLLMDPVFSDPFQGDLVVSCPQRVVHVEKLPRPHAIFLSHSHLDHYHAPSLRQLPRDLPVYCPRDPELVRMLGVDGFSNIHHVEGFQEIQLGDLTVVVTPSDSYFAEVGALLLSGGASVWNQVDTVISQRTCAAVQRRVGGALDVVFAAYRPLLEFAGMWREEVAFPQERYERLLETAIATGARTVIPGSAGLRCADVNGWANHRIFPVSREQFLKDLSDVAPELDGRLVHPGQSVVVREGEVTVEDSPYASVVELDEERVSFRPDDFPAPVLRDPNAQRHGEAQMVTALRALVDGQLERAINDALDEGAEGPLRTLRDRRAVVQVEIVCPSRTLSWHVVGWTPQVALREGSHGDPDYTFQYVGSEVYGYLRGSFRRMPQVVARRRQNRPRTEGEPFRFSTLHPARLHGVDAYFSVDDTYEWNPLALLD